MTPDMLHQLAVLTGVVVLAYVSPGPDFVAVTSHALGSRRGGVGVALGVAAASLLWAGLAMLGLSLFLSRLGWLYEALKIAGALYLVWLGGRMLVGAVRAPKAMADDPAPVARQAGFRAGFRRGVMVSLTNPKAATFFGSLFVSLLPASAPVEMELAALAIVGVVAGGWFSLVALLFSGRRVQSAYARARRWLDAAMGAVLVGLGARLAVSS